MAGGSERRATCRCRAANSRASISRWSSCRSRTRSMPATRSKDQILADGKHVVVIGGGDTGSDCVGTCNRHGAKSVTQFECCRSRRTREQAAGLAVLADQAAHLVDATRKAASAMVAIATKAFIGEDGRVRSAQVASASNGRTARWSKCPASEFVIKADLVLLAMGFVSPVASVLEAFGVEKRRARQCPGRRPTATAATDVAAQGVRRRRHAARPVARGLGDPRRAPGARAVDEFLMGVSALPR